jgi:hypothetical protein
LLRSNLFLIAILFLCVYLRLRSQKKISYGGRWMKKINMGRVLLAAFVASLSFLFIETVLEGTFYLMTGVSEGELFKEAYMSLPSGFLYYAVTIIYLYSVCVLMMWIYAAIRPRFKTHINAALATSLVFWLFAFLFIVNYSNLGLHPLKLGLLSMGFNIVELPVSLIAGSLVYKE